ncbi:hypothetical protein [Arthrobacter mobilis]|uniref:Uncharacterized protein n=1 Tax=Arthrobacter mobilis TaxID=2724944 RepID=A0A7X6HFW0_9MICC|nr:hypothetical protein [Arthrobacter mobilis]NKX56281.1 hypothetical protein [Arthrobacter mobilis]
MGKWARQAVELAEQTQEAPRNTVAGLQAVVGKLNVIVSMIEDLVVNEVENWRDMHQQEVNSVDKQSTTPRELSKSEHKVDSGGPSQWQK